MMPAMQQKQRQKQSEQQQPARSHGGTRVDRIKEGAVTVDIYRNDGPNGPFHSLSISRSYFQKKSDSWVETNKGFKLKQAQQALKALEHACCKMELLDEFEQKQFRAATEPLSEASFPAKSNSEKKPATPAA